MSFSRRYQRSETSENDVFLKNICQKKNLEISFKKNSTKENILDCKRKKVLSWSKLDYLQAIIKDIFLPQGYPDSVSKDYLEYQIWDSCQAFCSCISGTLSMSAVMEGVGVGSDIATPVSAAITWIIKDGTGMIGSIIFAWSKGSRLDSDCKKWRLFADILNDAAMCLELYIPFIKEFAMFSLCISTTMKALVGVAGSATRAALTCHQAIQGNMADVSAKDGSQEIFVNLCAYIFGIFLLKNVTETDKIWAVMVTFILLHLYSNYKAVACLKINVYNRERYLLSIRSFLIISDVARVEQVNRMESVILGFGITEKKIFGYEILLGTSLENAMCHQKFTSGDLMFLTIMFQSKNYLILPFKKQRQILVTFRKCFNCTDVLKGYFHAALAAAALGLDSKREVLPFVKIRRKNSPIFRLEKLMREFNSEKKIDTYKSQFLPVAELISCDQLIEREFGLFSKLSVEQGWNLNKNLLHIGDWIADWIYVEEKKTPLDIKIDPKLSLKGKRSPR